MRRVATIALIVASVASFACAQRGASHGGFSGHSGPSFHGAVGRSAPAFHGSFTGSAPSRLAAPPRYGLGAQPGSSFTRPLQYPHAAQGFTRSAPGNSYAQSASADRFRHRIPTVRQTTEATGTSIAIAVTSIPHFPPGTTLTCTPISWDTRIIPTTRRMRTTGQQLRRATYPPDTTRSPQTRTNSRSRRPGLPTILRRPPPPLKAKPALRSRSSPSRSSSMTAALPSKFTTTLLLRPPSISLISSANKSPSTTSTWSPRQKRIAMPA